MTRPRHALVTFGILALLGAGARAQNTSPDMAAPACTSDSDCSATPGTPRCCVGSSCMPVNVCVACVDDTGNPCAPIACDAALCDTTNGAACTLGRGLGSRGSPIPSSFLLVVGICVMALARRRRERGR
jgi:hypothetical protein